MNRLATAPISWGICEVPGWGIQLPVERVLAEMAEMGFPATELGSEGYLPSDPNELRSVLARHDLTLLAAFVPLVVHDVAQAEANLGRAESMAGLLEAGGARYFNTAPVTSDDWQPRETLSDPQWSHASEMFARIDDICDRHGLTQVLHSHVGTIVETKADVERVLAESTVQFVLDTAHLAVGGYDPVDFVRDAAERVGLVHIKDADLTVAKRLNEGELTLMQAVQADMFPPVGQGDLHIDVVIEELEAAGYEGWYVLEQDVAITGERPDPGEGPIDGIRTSLEYLRGLEERLAS